TLPRSVHDDSLEFPPERRQVCAWCRPAQVARPLPALSFLYCLEQASSSVPASSADRLDSARTEMLQRLRALRPASARRFCCSSSYPTSKPTELHDQKGLF